MGVRIIRLARMTARCKGAAIYLSYILISQVHLPVHLPCYDLPPLYCDRSLFNLF